MSASDQSVVLLPCPFCGDKAVVEYVKEVFFQIGCKGGNCLCSIYTQATAHPLHQMPARIRQWNFRPSLTVSVQSEGQDGPAVVFDELQMAMAYVRAIGKPAKVWFKSGSSVLGQ